MEMAYIHILVVAADWQAQGQPRETLKNPGLFSECSASDQLQLKTPDRRFVNVLA